MGCVMGQGVDPATSWFRLRRAVGLSALLLDSVQFTPRGYFQKEEVRVA